MNRIIIVGGGISGLAAAHRLAEARAKGSAFEITLLEAAPRLGGVLQTIHRDGFLLETGPDCFITEKPAALQLCQRLGLGGELIGTNESHRGSFVVRDGRLLPVPEGFYLLAPVRVWPFLTSPVFSFGGKLRILWERFVPARAENTDESLADFVRRRLGREALERMAQPMVAGITTADPETLSVRATFPGFHEMERTDGGVIRGLCARAKGRVRDARSAAGPRYGLFATLRSGMQTLADALAARLDGATVRTGVRAAEVAPGPGGDCGRWRVLTESGESIAADAVCLAVPAPLAGALLRGVDAELARLLEAIPYASTATVHAAYRRADVPHPLDGFGFVVPAVERRDILACTFASVKFAGRAPEGGALLRAFLGGAARPDVAERDDAALEATVRKEFRELLGIEAAPLFVAVHRHPRSMAQYLVGHVRRVVAIAARVRAHPGLALAGNAYEGIGVPDCIRGGERAAEDLLAPAPGTSPNDPAADPPQHGSGRNPV